MIEPVTLARAQQVFERLPTALRIATLSPRYVVADAARDANLDPIFLLYQEGESFWLVGMHKGSVPGSDCVDLQSAYGYGGPLSNSDDQAFLNRAWDAYLAWCSREGVLAEFVRFHPMAGNDRMYGGTVREDRATVAVPLLPEAPASSYATRARRWIGKATRAGVCAEWREAGAIRSRFAGPYHQAMRDIGASSFYMFPDDYFQAIAGLPEARFVECVAGGEVLSLGLFFFRDEIVEYHLGVTTAAGKAVGSAYLMFDLVAKRGHAEAKRWLYLGGGTNGEKENPLLFFKAGFSPHRFPFRVGHCVHQPREYARLRAAYPNDEGRSSRVLFYR